jgi:hypothetical protein
VTEQTADAATAADETPSAAAVPTREKHLEVVATILLALAALATAWSGYQASLWDGIQASDYSQASARRTEGETSAIEANQQRLADLGMFENYLDASAAGETGLADFYRQRFRDEFRPAFEAWEALDPLNNPDAPASPFALPEYRLAADAEAQQLKDEAHDTFEDGESANDTSDTYVATTLFFAAVLFFAAISERFSFLPARLALLTLAGVGLVVGVAVVATQPVTSG